MLKPLTRIAAACALLFNQSAYAASLQDVLRQSLQNDPELLEAQANKEAAKSDIEIAKSGHLPVLTLNATQVLTRKNRYDSERTRGINPSLQGKLNLYSFGGVNSRIRYSEHKYDYFHHKYYETQEVVGQSIAKLYLAALRAKESIQAAQNNLKRHDQIISDLKIITQYDKGRQSELDQAIARRLRVQAYLAEQTRILELNLSRLGKYTQVRLNPAALQDPFAGENAITIVRRYRNEDLANQPSYQAQEAERESAVSEIEVNKASRFPTIDLIATASRDNKEIYVNFGWDFFNPTANYQVDRSAQTLVAAEAKSDQILRDVSERTRSAEVDMKQSLNRTHIAEQQIAAQKKVIKAYELQFKIARRTLIDVLDSYSDLWSIELAAVASRNDFRDAALEYLSSQAAIIRWAGIEQDRSAPAHPERKAFKDYLPDNFLPENLKQRLNSAFHRDDKQKIQTDTSMKDGEPVLDYNQVTQDNIVVNMPAVGSDSAVQTEPVLNYQQINDDTKISKPVTKVEQSSTIVEQNQPVLSYDDIVGEQDNSVVLSEEVYQPRQKMKQVGKSKIFNYSAKKTRQPENGQSIKMNFNTLQVDGVYINQRIKSKQSKLVGYDSAKAMQVDAVQSPDHDDVVTRTVVPTHSQVPKFNGASAREQNSSQLFTVMDKSEPVDSVQFNDIPRRLSQVYDNRLAEVAQTAKVKLVDAPEYGVVWDTQPESLKDVNNHSNQNTAPIKVLNDTKADQAKIKVKQILKKAKSDIKKGKKNLNPTITSKTGKIPNKKKLEQKVSSNHDITTHWVLEANVPYDNV